MNLLYRLLTYPTKYERLIANTVAWIAVAVVVVLLADWSLDILAAQS